MFYILNIYKNINYVLGPKMLSLADPWTLPVGLVPMHWNIPASVPINPKIFKLLLQNINIEYIIF